METPSSLRRRELLVTGAGLGFAGLAGCTAPDPDPDPDDEVTIHHLDVGQAEATVIQTPADETVVVDTGNWWQDGEPVLDYLDAVGIEHIDHLVATHAHADHIGGHAEVIEAFETERDGIGLLYDPGIPHGTATYEEYLDAVEAHDKELLLLEEGDSLPVDGLDVMALNPPTGESGDELHYNCVTLHVEGGDASYLVTGDAEADAESRMVEAWGSQLAADVYQTGHHGSSTSSSTAFLDTVDPARTVVSSAFDSQFGHPHDEVLLSLDAFDIETYWTGVHEGTTVTVENGTVTVEPAESFSTDPLDIMDATPDTTDGLASAAIPESGTLVVDRIEAGAAVLHSEADGRVTGESVVLADRLPPGAVEGAVLPAESPQGEQLTASGEAARGRYERVADRLTALSRPLSAVS